MLVRRSTVHAACLGTCFALSNACSNDTPPASDAGDGGASTIAGEWKKGVSLSRPIRFESVAVVVRGRIHLVGGITGVFGNLSTVEPYTRIDVLDPARGEWSPGPELPTDAPKHHLAVTVANDAIYIMTGFDGIQGKEGFRPVGVAYVLEGENSATWKWRKLTPPPLARGGATAQAIGGRIYVAGGAPDEMKPSYDRLDVYDIATDTWSTKSPMPTAREHVGSCLIDGKMIVVGGWKDEMRIGQNAAELYDPEADRWTVLPPMFTRRGAAGVATHTSERDGVTRCHVLGGEDWGIPPPGTFAAHEVFDPKTNAWANAPPMPTARHGVGVASVGGALYAIAGGETQGSAFLDVVEVFR